MTPEPYPPGHRARPVRMAGRGLPEHPLPPHVAEEGQRMEHAERLVSAALSHDGSWGAAGESCPCPPEASRNPC